MVEGGTRRELQFPFLAPSERQCGTFSVIHDGSNAISSTLFLLSGSCIQLGCLHLSFESAGA